MADGKDPTLVKQTLDKDLVKIGRAEAAVQATARSVVGPGLAFLFLAAIVVVGGALLGGQDNGLLIIAAAAIGQGSAALNHLICLVETPSWHQRRNPPTHHCRGFRAQD